jgi:hypothetical protein
MADTSERLRERLQVAVQHFWTVRGAQATKQGGELEAEKDRGERSAVTAGRHMDGFFSLVRAILVEAGLADAAIFTRSRTELPGWFRSDKDWDLLIVADQKLIGAIEFKSQVGPSFGNNFNNRTEEALGNATDLWAAYREGAFKPSERPWLGYLMLLEECPKSLRPVRPSEPHFRVFPEFAGERDSRNRARGVSYAKRYEILIMKLVRERLYEAGCLLLSNRTDGLTGAHTEPNPELGFHQFAESLMARAIAYARMRG